MEHRWSPRKAFTMDVTLHSDTGVHPARVCDVSLEGMYLQPAAPGLETGAMVEVAFTLRCGRGSRHSIKAFVVRTDARGVAVLFLEFEIDAFRYFQHLIYSAA